MGNRAKGYSRAAHPRSRGEHMDRHDKLSTLYGSSPLARGTRVCISTHAECCRLIPARAGNTCRQDYGGGAGSAHPRSRGEHTRPALAPDVYFGSSPLARGTRRRRHEGYWRFRLIPARAGNTQTGRVRQAADPAHPRSRGEHVPSEKSGMCRGGSSPLARGTQCDVGHAGVSGRLIPARAGNTAFFPGYFSG